MCLFLTHPLFIFQLSLLQPKPSKRYEYNSSTDNMLFLKIDKTDNITNCHNDIIDTSKILYTTTELHQKINY